jgi:hypothetical protein
MRRELGVLIEYGHGLQRTTHWHPRAGGVVATEMAVMLVRAEMRQDQRILQFVLDVQLTTDRRHFESAASFSLSPFQGDADNGVLIFTGVTGAFHVIRP